MEADRVSLPAHPCTTGGLLVRQPKPWYRAAKSAWYVEQLGKQVCLSEHPDGAPPPKKSKAGWNPPQPILETFYKLMASDPATLPDPARVVTAQVCDLFLSHSERHNEPAMYRWYKHFPQSFCTLHWRTPAVDLSRSTSPAGSTRTTGRAAAATP